jgi:multimeric flavodoxin WrbA
MEEKLKLLAIAGSPRRGGNTDLLLQEVIAGAESRGATVRTIFLSELAIAPCEHCDKCLETGRCAVEDDMQWVHNELRGTDRLVLASPIFFMGVTAQTKAMIDRCQALWVTKYVLKLPLVTNGGRERRGLFVSVAGRKGKAIFEPAIATVKSFFKTLDIAYADELLFRGIDEKGAIAHHPTALREAFEAGKRLAKD